MAAVHVVHEGIDYGKQGFGCMGVHFVCVSADLSPHWLIGRFLISCSKDAWCHMFIFDFGGCLMKIPGITAFYNTNLNDDEAVELLKGV